jgi:hypothetical protein
MNGAAVMPNSIIPNPESIHLLIAEFLLPAEIAGILGVSRKMLAEWRLKRQGPPFMLRARGVVVYPAESFRRYLLAHSQKEFTAREPLWNRAVAINVPNSLARAGATGCGTGRQA